MLLSGSIGSGHDTLAKACADSLERRGWQHRTLDAMALLGQRGPAAAGDWVFRHLLAVPPVYDAFHFNQLRPHGAIARRMEAAALRFLWPRLVDALAGFPPDLIIAVFATGATAAARWKQEHPATATVVFNTDQVSYGMWVPDGIDLFLVTSTAARQWVRRYAPEAAAMVVTAPVRGEFYDPPARHEARAACGVPDGARCVLVMAGGWGLGPLPEITDRLAAEGLWVLAVAGNNRRLRSALEAVARRRPNVVAFGFTDRVAELMAAADLVLTTPGDTCREARAVGRAMALLDAVPGHGRENLQHELELGAATVVSLDPHQVATTVVAFLDDPAHEPAGRVGSPAQWEEEFDQVLARLELADRA